MSDVRRGLMLWGLVICCLAGPAALMAADPPPLNPARWEPEIRKFEEADEKSPVPPGRIVFVGSSSIRLWDLEESFPGLDALNRGFGGSELSDTVTFFERIVRPYKPRVIVVYAGDNDLAKGRTPQFVSEQFAALLKKRDKDLPGTPLVFIGIKPSIKRWNLIEQVREANALIKAQCESAKNVTFVDIDAPMIGSDGQPRPELFAKDGLHLSPAGYQLWNSLVRPLISGDARLGHKRGLYDAYHPWTPPATLEEWNVASERIKRQVQVACGLWPMPEKGELNPVIHSPVNYGDYTVAKVFFQSAPGLYVSGELYKPNKINGKVPAVLCAHGHYPDGRFHHSSEEVINRELATGAEGFRSTASAPGQALAMQLARMGVISFFYDMIGNADQKPLSHRGGFSDADASLWLHNHLGLQTWNSIRALDFVSSLPEVDTTRLGITGASGGGTQTMMLAAIDPRVSLAFPAVMVSTGMQGGCICENADLLRVGINNIAIAAAFAPRPMSMAAADDWTLKIETRGLPELKHVYGLYGAADKVDAKCFPQFPHNYNQVSREVFYNWVNEHFRLGLESPVRQTDFWPIPREQQTVFNEKHPRPADALEEGPFRDVLRKRDGEALEKLLSKSPDEYLTVIRRAVDIMAPVATGELRAQTGVSTDEQDQLISTEVDLQSGQTHVPVQVVRKPTATSKVVLWVDGAGLSHLKQADGKWEPAVQKLLDAGFAVASADLLLTGSMADAHNPYVAKLKSPSPSHVVAKPGEDYAGFLYGYNLSLLAERMNDLDRVVTYLHSQGFKEIHLVGTGDAGVWALLARARWSPDRVSSTIVDLNGFRFSQIDSVLDPNLIPGALKYGGIGGMSAIAYPAPLTISGAGDLEDAELAPLRKVYGDQAGLKLTSPSLSREQIVESILTR